MEPSTNVNSTPLKKIELTDSSVLFRDRRELMRLVMMARELADQNKITLWILGFAAALFLIIWAGDLWLKIIIPPPSRPRRSPANTDAMEDPLWLSTNSSFNSSFLAGDQLM